MVGRAGAVMFFAFFPDDFWEKSGGVEVRKEGKSRRYGVLFSHDLRIGHGGLKESLRIEASEAKARYAGLDQGSVLRKL